ncbi:MAG: cation-translocating P-type ATPase [Chloroflexota bacterium]
MTVANVTPTDERPASVLTSDEALTRAGVDANSGLTTDEALTRLQRYGPNKFAEARTEPRWQRFLRQYEDLMQIVLLVAGIISIVVVDALSTGLLLLGLTAFNAMLGVNQEGKAAAAVSALQEMMIVTAKVRRGGDLMELPAEKLVPGDIVSVEAGDLIPADGRLLTSATLEVDESPLTGESLPVAKDAANVAEVDTPLGDRVGMVFMNTSVTRGSGSFLVTSTGMGTEVGHISDLLDRADDLKTPLTRQLDKLTRQLIAVAGIALIASMVLGLMRGQSFDVLFVAAVAFAVAAIPTGLPAIVTTILSQGTRTLADAGAIVKRLRSVETLGSTSAINSDKTGTLTMNQMTAVEMVALGRHYEIDGSGYSTEGNILRNGDPAEQKLDPLLLPMVLASDAVVRDGELVGDPTEGALVVLAAKGGLGSRATREAYPREAVLPFDAAYKLMATFHSTENESGKKVIRAFVKGAPDQLIERTAKTLDGDSKVIDFGDQERTTALAENERLGSQGLRVLAVGRKDLDPKSFDPDGDLLEQLDGLTLLALVGIVDPPRPSVKESIATARRAGITVRMITGDHVVTAKAIGRELGIEGRAMSGAEFRAMSDDEALKALPDIGIIARVTPEDKVHLVDLLQRQGHIVAMTGDGVNDAPALKQADIGVAMGITGTEVSKEAAVMILTDDDFSTIVRAVRLGRNIYDNLTKYIRFQMAGLFGFVATFLGASIFWIAGGVPFLPAQTIWVNFTVQMSQAMGLGFGEPEPGLMDRKPRPSNQPILGRQMLTWLAFVGLIMGAGTLAVIGWGNQEFGSDVGRSMGLATFSFMNIAFSLGTKDMIRSSLSVEVLGDRSFVMATIASILVTFAANELGLLQRLLGTVSLTFDQWIISIVVGWSILLVSEIRKLVWKKPFDQPSDEAASVAPVSTN